jgi:large conductance mechanosensitive channel
MWKDFKGFIMRGNVLDLAVGIIIGGAFGAIVASLVKDIIMPPIGLLLGRINFTDLFLSLNGQQYASLKAAQDAGAATINYGLFINTIINFIIVAFAIFVVVRWFTRLQQARQAPAPAAAPTTKDCPYCYTSINIKATRCPNCTSELT